MERAAKVKKKEAKKRRRQVKLKAVSSEKNVTPVNFINMFLSCYDGDFEKVLIHQGKERKYPQQWLFSVQKTY